MKEGVVQSEVVAAVFAEMTSRPDCECPAMPPLFRSHEALLLEHAI